MGNIFGHPTFPGNSGWFSNHFGENFENENSEEQVAPVPDIDTAVWGLQTHLVEILLFENYNRVYKPLT